jgi:hypothetical protein
VLQEDQQCITPQNLRHYKIYNENDKKEEDNECKIGRLCKDAFTAKQVMKMRREFNLET